jgi:hypothetical protein
VVRRVLYMATLSAVRHNPVLHAYYQRLLGRGAEPKAALIAALRKMVTILNAMVCTTPHGGHHAQVHRAAANSQPFIPPTRRDGRRVTRKVQPRISAPVHPKSGLLRASGGEAAGPGPW